MFINWVVDCSQLLQQTVHVEAKTTTCWHARSERKPTLLATATVSARGRFSRLAKAFSLDNDQLVEDFHVLKPLAQRIFTREDVPNMLARQRAVQEWQSGRPAPPMSIRAC